MREIALSKVASSRNLSDVYLDNPVQATANGVPPRLPKCTCLRRRKLDTDQVAQNFYLNLFTNVSCLTFTAFSQNPVHTLELDYVAREEVLTTDR